jgi:hypothetical protein
VKKRNAFWVKEKPEEKRPFGRPSRMWKVNNKTGLKERGWERCRPYSSVSEHRQVSGLYERGNELCDVIKFRKFLDYLRNYAPQSYTWQQLCFF